MFFYLSFILTVNVQKFFDQKVQKWTYANRFEVINQLHVMD